MTSLNPAIPTTVVNRPLAASYEDAINAATQELGVAMTAFDSWIATNAGFTQDTPEYKTQKQNIKLLRAKIVELQEKQAKYGNVLKSSTFKGKYIEGPFARPRNALVTSERIGNKVGDRVHQKLSRG